MILSIKAKMIKTEKNKNTNLAFKGKEFESNNSINIIFCNLKLKLVNKNVKILMISSIERINMTPEENRRN
jgi:hypothetical protein